jgi:endo-1,4-beta-mannosidase
MATLLDQSFFRVRGFGYQPSYAPTGLEIWHHFDERLIATELGRAKEHFPGTNAIRLWLSFDAWLRDPARFVRNFGKALDILGRLGLRAMPCLFNNWRSLPDFGGVAAEMVGYWNSPQREINYFLRYADDLVTPYLRDERILAWDLCNEPFNSGRDEVFVPWLETLHGFIKGKGASAPVTIGVPPDLGQLTTVEPMCDVLTPHLYAGSAASDAFVEFANGVGKPMFAGETGWGSLDDGARLATLHGELSALIERRVGFMIHVLHHSLVADCHRAEFGPVSEVGFMGCIEADGTMRAGYESIRKYFTT